MFALADRFGRAAAIRHCRFDRSLVALRPSGFVFLLRLAHRLSNPGAALPARGASSVFGPVLTPPYPCGAAPGCRRGV